MPVKGHLTKLIVVYTLEVNAQYFLQYFIVINLTGGVARENFLMIFE